MLIDESAPQPQLYNPKSLIARTPRSAEALNSHFSQPRLLTSRLLASRRTPVRPVAVALPDLEQSSTRRAVPSLLLLHRPFARYYSIRDFSLLNLDSSTRLSSVFAVRSSPFAASPPPTPSTPESSSPPAAISSSPGTTQFELLTCSIC